MLKAVLSCWSTGGEVEESFDASSGFSVGLGRFEGRSFMSSDTVGPRREAFWVVM